MRRLYWNRLWVVVVGVFILLITSCASQREIWVVRIPFEELREGAFYGGSLVFNPEDPSRSHLAKGTLIAFQDITYGWEDVGNEEFEPYDASKKYGYIYIRRVEWDEIEYDYLVYGPNGEIIERADGLSMGLLAGAPDFAKERSSEGFRGFVYHSNLGSTHDLLKHTPLLSFIHEVPEEAEEGAHGLYGREILPQDEYRRMVFRIENPGKVSFHSQNGVIGTSIGYSKGLVMNSAFYSVVELEGSSEDQIAFSRTDQLPDFHEGDYILDAHYDGVRLIVAVDDSNNDYILLTTEKADMEDALGTVVVELDGDLSQIIQRYGSPKDQRRLADAEERFRATMINKKWTIRLPDSGEIRNAFRLDVNVSLNFHLSWKEVSSKGTISFPMSFHSILAIEAIAGFSLEDDYNLADPGISFSVSGVPVRVSVPIDFYYELKAELAKMELEIGPTLDVELGFSYDVGAKIKFKWKVIPKGVSSWARASGINHESFSMHTKIGEIEDARSLTTEIGLKASPGITIASVIRPQLSFPLGLRGRLAFSSPPSSCCPDQEARGGKLTLDFVTRGNLEIVLDVKFFEHTFKLGQMFEYTKNLYTKDL